MGLEPISPAWEAGAQPIYQGRFDIMVNHAGAPVSRISQSC